MFRKIPYNANVVKQGTVSIRPACPPNPSFMSGIRSILWFLLLGLVPLLPIKLRVSQILYLFWDTKGAFFQKVIDLSLFFSLKKKSHLRSFFSSPKATGTSFVFPWRGFAHLRSFLGSPFQSFSRTEEASRMRSEMPFKEKPRKSTLPFRKASLGGCHDLDDFWIPRGIYREEFHKENGIHKHTFSSLEYSSPTSVFPWSLTFFRWKLNRTCQLVIGSNFSLSPPLGAS